MFNLIYTVIVDIITSLRITTWLEIMALFTCVMLLGSPGGIATILGAGTKLGIYNYVKRGEEATE